MKFFSRKLAIFNCVLTLLFTVLSKVDTLGKIRLLPDDPRGIVGESLQMWCSIDSTSGYKSSDLELHFLKNSRKVDSHSIRIVNRTTVELNYPDLSLILNDAKIICGLNPSRFNLTEITKSKLYDSQILRVGYRPFKPYIVKPYMVYNWEHFTFSWNFNQTDPVYLTKYEAWYKSSKNLEFIRCSGSRISKQQGNTCKIARALELVHPNGELHFKVNGSNVVGQVSSNTEKANLHHIIQPGKVRNVTVNSTVSNGVVAEFYSPSDVQPLKYRIHVACGNITWSDVVIKNLSYHNSRGPLRCKLQHVLPPFTACHLSVSCLPFYNRRYWSDWSENVSFTSPDGVPLVGPRLCCYETKQHGIYIYYKSLTKKQARGEVVRYHVQRNILTSGSQMNYAVANITFLEPNKPFFPFPVDLETSYTVSISAETRAGRNSSAVSLMPVLSQYEILPFSFPQNMTAIWHGSRTVIVSWLPLEAKLFDYTIVWCKGSIQCEKPVDWEITSYSSHEIQLPPDETYLSYRFGIAVSRAGGGSSGIQWLNCTYNISAGASSPNVHMLNKTSSAVSFHINEPKCEGGYIYEYLVYYVKDKTVSVVRNPHQLKSADWNIVIDHLEPDSNYSFHVVALTYNGPSEESVVNIRTDRSGKLSSAELVSISIGAVIGFVFVVIGIFSCCRWNKMQLLRFRKWFKMDITIPRKQTLDTRGSADGGHLSSSYTSLSKNLEPLLRGSNTLHSEHMKNPGSKDEKEEVLTVAGGTSPVVQNMRPSVLTATNLIVSSESLLAISEDRCNTSSMPSGQAVKCRSSNYSLSCKHPLDITIGHGRANDDTVCCGIDHAAGSAEESNPMNGILFASIAEAQSEEIDEVALVSQDVVADNLGNVTTSLSSNCQPDGSDEVQDYSNVRIVDAPEYLESSGEVSEDGYSHARPPAGDNELTEEESDDGYSNAMLLDDLDYQPVLQSLIDDSNHDESVEDEDDVYNYSRASAIRRLQ